MIRKALEVWQLSFAHPPADERRIHPVETEYDEALRVLTGRPPRAEEGRLGECDGHHHSRDREKRGNK